MKKTALLTILTLTISSFLITTQVLASSAANISTKGGPPSGTPGSQHTPEAQNTHGPRNTPGAQATAHATNQDCRGKHQNYRGTITSVNPLQLTLRDGSPISFALTQDTRMKFPGPNGSTAALQSGMQAMVQAVADQNGNLTACAVMAIPGQPTRVHRVGWVTEYTPGVSITIRASDGNTYTFALTGDTKILPAGSEVNPGSRVTIIAPRDPSALGWTAIGIVVHPVGSGEGSMPPTEVPSATPTP
jgi:hypothetical protein